MVQQWSSEINKVIPISVYYNGDATSNKIIYREQNKKLEDIEAFANAVIERWTICTLSVLCVHSLWIQGPCIGLRSMNGPTNDTHSHTFTVKQRWTEATKLIEKQKATYTMAMRTVQRGFQILKNVLRHMKIIRWASTVPNYQLNSVYLIWSDIRYKAPSVRTLFGKKYLLCWYAYQGVGVYVSSAHLIGAFTRDLLPSLHAIFLG